MAALTVESLAALLADMQKKQKEERDNENKLMQDSFNASIKTEVSEQIVISLQPMESRQSKLESDLLELKSVVAKLQETNTHSFSKGSKFTIREEKKPTGCQSNELFSSYLKEI